MSLVVVVNCGAWNAQRGFEISMFYIFPKLYSIHISRDILLLWAQNIIKQCKCYFPKSRNVKDYENVKLVNLSSSTAAQMPLVLYMISKNSDFGVGGNIKFFTEANFILINTKFSTMNQKIILQLSAFKSSSYMERCLRYDQICVEKLSLVKIRKNKPKHINFLISTSNYQIYTKFTSRYMFLWMANAMRLVKISLRITNDVKIEDGRQLCLKNRSWY